MTGRTRLIINALKNSIPLKQIAIDLAVSEKAIYQAAKTYNISISPKAPRILKTKILLTEEEKELKKSIKKIADARRYEEKRLKRISETPHLPMTSAKLGPLSSLNAAWIAAQGSRRGSVKEHMDTQMRYGLKTSCKQH